jgi:type IV pilus assembly protein PilZ
MTLSPATPVDDDDRRFERRLPLQMLVEYESTADFLVDYTANISIGGMFIKTDRPLEVGARFRLRFQLPRLPRPIDTMAIVRWSLRPEEAGPMTAGMGIRFETLAPADREEVERLLFHWDDLDAPAPR